MQIKNAGPFPLNWMLQIEISVIKHIKIEYKLKNHVTQLAGTKNVENFVKSADDSNQFLEQIFFNDKISTYAYIITMYSIIIIIIITY